MNEFGELNDDRKWKELHYQDVRKEKEEMKEFDHEIRDELTAGRGRLHSLEFSFLLSTQRKEEEQKKERKTL